MLRSALTCTNEIRTRLDGWMMGVSMAVHSIHASYQSLIMGQRLQVETIQKTELYPLHFSRYHSSLTACRLRLVTL